MGQQLQSERMRGTLKVEIKIANAATQAPDDLNDLMAGVGMAILEGKLTGKIYDYNGNPVGRFDIEEEE